MNNLQTNVSQANEVQGKEPPTISVSLRGWQWFVAGIAVSFMLFGGVSACYQGRDISRWTGRAQRVELPDDLRNYEDIVTVSFHKNGNGETLKDITYIGADGKLHSREYKDWGLLEGEIVWDLNFDAGE